MISLFKKYGHDILDIKKHKKGRLSDFEIVKLANKQGRVIITLDKDFLILLQNSKISFKLVYMKVESQKKEDMLRAGQYILTEKIWEKMQKRKSGSS